MATTSRHDSPKIAIVGTLVSDSAGAIPYVFRNYNFAANVTSSYRGSVRYTALLIFFRNDKFLSDDDTTNLRAPYNLYGLSPTKNFTVD